MLNKKQNNKTKYLLTALAAVSLSACATIDETWDGAMFRITSAECKLFKAEQYGKCMREHYPRVEQDYNWENKSKTE